ncbi:MAG: PAS domain S-box protein [Rhodobacteraceae bacterium]|nr:PAS domain S-box protein [Paracoccaceae bacterium]
MSTTLLSIDHFPAPALLVSESGIITECNLMAAELLKTPRSEVEGKPLDSLLVDLWFGRQNSTLDHALLSATPPETLLKQISKTRDGRDVIVSIFPGPSEGRTSAAYCIALSQGEAPGSSSQNFRDIVDASASAIIMCDAKGAIRFASRAAGGLFGYDLDSLIGMCVEQLVPGRLKKHHEDYRAEFGKAMKPRAMGRKSKVTAVHKEGHEIPIEIVLTPVNEADAEIMCTIVDLTEHVATQTEISEKAKELEQLNAELSAFANSASHDLKAPLCSIEGLLSLCLEDFEAGDAEELKKNLEEALLISRSNASKVEKIIELAQAGQAKLNKERFSLRADIVEIWRSLRSVGSAGAVLEFDLRHGDIVNLERAAMNMILANLLSNALRYGDPEKPSHVIRISSRRENNQLQMVVGDNGRGISRGNLQRVFTYFSRFDELSNEGVGLALVRKQIERLGGAISVHSVEGQGTEFSFLIPLEEREE